jgi:hypothetical protein
VKHFKTTTMSGWGAAAGAAVQGITGIAGAAMTNNANKGMNREAINFQREVMRYNTPLEQRKRLEAAGMNPNLAYGNGHMDNTSSESPPPLRAADWTPAAASVGDAVANYFNFTAQQEQIENAKKQRDVMDSEIISKAVQNGKTIADTANSWFQLKQGESLLGGAIDMQHEQIRKLENENTILDKDIATYDPKVQKQFQEADARIKQALASTDLQRVQAALQKESLELRKLGVTENDPLWQRLIGKHLPEIKSMMRKASQKMGGSLKSFSHKRKDQWRSWLPSF